MLIHRKSAVSGKINSRNIPVNPDDLLAWEAGHGNIQDLMPYLNASDREFIISGITDSEWNAIFQEVVEV